MEQRQYAERDEQDKEKNWYVMERSYGSLNNPDALRFRPRERRLKNFSGCWRDEFGLTKVRSTQAHSGL
jgi:hypothetical protein